MTERPPVSPLDKRPTAERIRALGFRAPGSYREYTPIAAPTAASGTPSSSA